MTAVPAPVPRPGTVLARRWLLPAPAGPGDAPPFSRHAWQRTVLVMHAAFVVLVGLTVVAAAVGSGDGHARGPWAVTALGVLAVAYAVAGAAGLGGRHPRRAVAYLVVLVLACPVVAWAEPGLLFLLFLAYTQVWMLVEDWRPGLLWTLTLGVTTTAGLVTGLTPAAGSVLGSVTQMAIGLGFSVFMGLFVATLLRHSQHRADLIAALERTRAELAEVHHERGVAAERERLARDIHDTLAQGYTSVVVLAQTARLELAANQPDVAAERLAVIEDVARENLREARSVVAASTPPSLEGSGLVGALERLAHRHTRETGVPVTLDVDGFAGDGLRRDQEVVLLRVAQEALTNVRRHAGASAVDVALRGGSHDARIEVVDDGVGFDPAIVGYGLTGMAGRVEQAGGECTVESGPGRGARVRVRIPVG